jgi:hypothetical protein
VLLQFESLLQAAKDVLADIELMRMIRKGQLMIKGCKEVVFADHFYALAGS